MKDLRCDLSGDRRMEKGWGPRQSSRGGERYLGGEQTSVGD